jgi:hypothetical protein
MRAPVADPFREGTEGGGTMDTDTDADVGGADGRRRTGVAGAAG